MGDSGETDLMNPNIFEKDIAAFVKEKGSASNLLTKLQQIAGFWSNEESVKSFQETAV